MKSIVHSRWLSRLTPLLLTALWLLGVVQTPVLGQTYFNERYDNRSFQSGATNVIANDSGYVVFGQALHIPTWQGQALLVRFLNPDGQQRRVRYFQRAGMAYYSPFGGSGLLPQLGGGYLLAGTVLDSALRYGQPMLWCFSATGDTLWTRTYRIGIETALFGGCRAANQDIVLVGMQWVGLDSTYAVVLRTDALGQPRWLRRYAVKERTAWVEAANTPDGGFLLSGDTYSQPTSQGCVMKIDSSGRRLWQRSFGVPRVDCGSARLLIAHDGTYWVTAAPSVRSVNGYAQRRTLLYKLSDQGQILWQKPIGPTSYNSGALVMHELPDGSIVVAGQNTDPTGATPVGNGFPQGFAFKVCANGDSVWYRTYKKLTGGNSHNYLRDFQPAPDGGFVSAGFLFAIAPDTGTSDSWVFKVDLDGYLQAGGAPPTVRCSPLGVAPEREERVLEAWPNPSGDGIFTVRQANPAAPVAGTVTDALGRIVWGGTFSGGEMVVDLSHLPAGLYVLRMPGRNGHQTLYKLVRL